MDRLFVSLGGLFGAAGVIGGALGAHVFKARLDAEAMGVYQTAVLYCLLHAMMLVVSGLRLRQFPASRTLRFAGAAFGLGILLFSGSLLLKTLWGPGWWSSLAPKGGSAFIAGWLLIALSGWLDTR